MQKKLVGIDCDGVLFDFNTVFLKYSRKLLAKPKKDFVVADFDYSKCGWTDVEVKRIFSYMKHITDFWVNEVGRLPNTSALAKNESKLEYFFITARLASDGLPVNYQTEQAIRLQFGLKAPYAIVASDKGKVAADLELDYFIDDKPEHCLEVANARPECKVFIIDATYNRKFVDSRITRAANFNEFIKEITSGD